jgi:hypothetical protein
MCPHTYIHHSLDTYLLPLYILLSVYSTQPDSWLRELLVYSSTLVTVIVRFEGRGNEPTGPQGQEETGLYKNLV